MLIRSAKAFVGKTVDETLWPLTSVLSSNGATLTNAQHAARMQDEMERWRAENDLDALRALQSQCVSQTLDVKTGTVFSCLQAHKMMLTFNGPRPFKGKGGFFASGRNRGAETASCPKCLQVAEALCDGARQVAGRVYGNLSPGIDADQNMTRFGEIVEVEIVNKVAAFRPCLQAIPVGEGPAWFQTRIRAAAKASVSAVSFVQTSTQVRGFLDFEGTPGRPWETAWGLEGGVGDDGPEFKIETLRANPLRGGAKATLEELSEWLGNSRHFLAKVFKSFVGKSPADFKATTHATHEQMLLFLLKAVVACPTCEEVKLVLAERLRKVDVIFHFFGSERALLRDIGFGGTIVNVGAFAHAIAFIPSQIMQSEGRYMALTQFACAELFGGGGLVGAHIAEIDVKMLRKTFWGLLKFVDESGVMQMQEADRNLCVNILEMQVEDLGSWFAAQPGCSARHRSGPSCGPFASRARPAVAEKPNHAQGKQTSLTAYFAVPTQDKSKAAVAVIDCDGDDSPSSPGQSSGSKRKKTVEEEKKEAKQRGGKKRLEAEDDASDSGDMEEDDAAESIADEKPVLGMGRRRLRAR